MAQVLGLFVALAVALVAGAAAWGIMRRHGLGDGGLAGMAALIVALPAGLAAGALVGREPAAQPALAALAIAALFVAAAGILTDAFATPRGVRAVAVVAAGVLLHAAGVGIDSVKLPFSQRFVTLGWSSLPFTVLWLWLSASVFGRAGTIPGVAYGVGSVAAATMYVMGALATDVVGASARYVALVLLGICLGVLPYAISAGKARATAGAYTLGFLVGTLAVMGALKNTAFLVAVVPLLLISVPLLAASYSVATDLRGGLLIRRAPRHLYDILIGQGYSAGQVLGVLLAGSVYVALVTLLLVALIEVHFLLKALLLVVLLAAGFAGGYVALRFLPRPRPFSGLRVAREATPLVPSAVEGRRHADTRVSVLGVEVTPTTLSGALELARGFIRDGRPHLIVTSDSAALVRAQDDPQYRQIVHEADLVTADGQGVVWAARLLDVPIYERVTGCDMVAHLSILAAQEGRSVFLLGSAPGVAEAAADKLKEQCRGLEWLYRLLRQPSRLRRLVALPRMVWMMVRELISPRAPSARPPDA